MILKHLVIVILTYLSVNNNKTNNIYKINNNSKNSYINNLKTTD